MKIALVGATIRYSAHYHFVFGDLIIHRLIEVWEGDIEQGGKVPEALTVSGFRISGKVCDAIKGKKLVDGSQVFVQFSRKISAFL